MPSASAVASAATTSHCAPSPETITLGNSVFCDVFENEVSSFRHSMASAGKCTASHKWRAAARVAGAGGRAGLPPWWEAAGCRLSRASSLLQARSPPAVASSSCGSELARAPCRASPSCTSKRARAPRLAVPERITHPPGPTALALQYFDIQPTCRARVQHQPQAGRRSHRHLSQGPE